MFFKPTFGGDLVGSGELKLSNGVINSWMRYITGDGKSINKPNDFFVTTDGEYSSYWYCPHGQCQPTKKRNAIKQCEERFERECRHFARRRNVVWKNGINTGKLKTSNFNSKMTRTEVIAKFTTLGFIGDRTSSSTATSTTTSTLKKKGRIIGSTPFIYRVHGAPKDYSRYTKDYLKKILKEKKFKKIEIYELGIGPFLASFSLLRSYLKFVPIFYQILLSLAIITDKILYIFMKTNPKTIYPIGYVFSAVKK